MKSPRGVIWNEDALLKGFMICWSDTKKLATIFSIILLAPRASLVAQLVKNLLAMQDPGLISGSERSTGEGVDYPLQCSWASLVPQLVNNLPSVWETWVRSLVWEDPLEKGKATHSSILAGRIP